MPPSNAIGFAFAPTFENARMEPGRGAGSQPQGAVQTLNYRLPRVSPGAISPLVGDRPAQGGFSSAVIESVLRTILGPDAMRGGMPQLPSAVDYSGGSSEASRRLPLPVDYAVGSAFLPALEPFLSPASVEQPRGTDSGDLGDTVFEKPRAAGRAPNPVVRPSDGPEGEATTGVLDETVRPQPRPEMTPDFSRRFAPQLPAHLDPSAYGYGNVPRF
jgi:hypothetical protein